MKTEHSPYVLATVWVKEKTILHHPALKEKEYANLYKRIIRHEQEHQPGPATINDFILDMNFNSLDSEIIYFTVTHPKSLIQLTGITPHKGHLLIDKGILTTWTLIILIGGITWILT